MKLLNQIEHDQIRESFPKSKVRTPHISCGQNTFNELDTNITVRSPNTPTQKDNNYTEELSLTDQIKEVIEMALNGYNRSKQLETKSPSSVRAPLSHRAPLELFKLKNLIIAREQDKSGQSPD